VDEKAIDGCASLRNPSLVSRLVPAMIALVVAASLASPPAALAAPSAHARHGKPAPSAKGRIGIGSAWGPVVVPAPHTSRR